MNQESFGVNATHDCTNFTLETILDRAVGTRPEGIIRPSRPPIFLAEIEWNLLLRKTINCYPPRMLKPSYDPTRRLGRERLFLCFSNNNTICQLKPFLSEKAKGGKEGSLESNTWKQTTFQNLFTFALMYIHFLYCNYRLSNRNWLCKYITWKFKTTFISGQTRLVLSCSNIYHIQIHLLSLNTMHQVNFFTLFLLIL